MMSSTILNIKIHFGGDYLEIYSLASQIIEGILHIRSQNFETKVSEAISRLQSIPPFYLTQLTKNLFTRPLNHANQY